MKVLVYDYWFFQKFWLESYNGKLFKWSYKDMWIYLGEKIYGPRGLWVHNPKNGFWGYMIDIKINGVIMKMWMDFNRINTHIRLFQYFCQEVYKIDKSINDDLQNRDYKNVLRKIHNLILSNINKYFPEYGETKESIEIQYFLDRSWFRGNLSTIGVVCYFYQKISGLVNIEYDFMTGLRDDMKGGIDTKMIYDTGNSTSQLKSGGISYNDDEYYYIKGASNSLEYTTSNYVYCDVKVYYVDVVGFKNVKDRALLDKLDNGLIKVHKSLIKIKERLEIPIPQKAAKIGVLTFDNKSSASIIGIDDVNYVKIEKNDDIKKVKVVINFVDSNDKAFESELDDSIKELEDFFK